MRDQQRQQRNQVVRLRDRESEFFQKSLEILLRALLAVKADDIMERIASALQHFGGDVIRLGLAYPLAGRPFHTVPCPWTRPQSEMTPLPQGAISCCSACGR